MKFPLLLFFLISLQFSVAQSFLSIEKAQHILLENNANIKQAELQQKIAKINIDQSYNALTPNINFSTSNQYTMGLNFDQITGQLITGNQWTNSINSNVSSSIVLFQGFREFNTIKSSKTSHEIAQLDIEKLKYELQIQLLSLFFQVLINYDLYQASLEQSKLSQQQLQQEETKIEVGKSTVIDLAQAKNKVANDQLNITNSKNAYDLSILKLKQLLELDVEKHISLIKPTLLLDNMAVYKSEFQQEKDPYLQLLEKQLDLSHIKTKLAKSDYYPSISLNTSYGTNYSSRRSESMYSSKTMSLLNQINQNRSLYIGLSISYAIYDKFTTRSNVKKAIIDIESLTLQKDKTLRDRKLNMEQVKLEYLAAIEEYKAIQVAYETNKINFGAMTERYNVGKSSSIDLFKAMTDFNIAEFRKITSQYNVLAKGSLLKFINSNNLN